MPRLTALALTFAILLGTIVAAVSPAAAAGLTVSPLSVAFGNVVFGLTGATSVARAVKIINPATGQAVTGLSVQISGADAGEFAITNNGCASTLAKGTYCTVMLTFTPAALGTRTASLAVGDDANLNAGSTALSGVGIPGKLTIAPLTLLYGNVVAGAASAAKTTTVKNLNTVALHINTVVQSGEFSITSDTCSGNDLAPAATCAVGAVFSPTLTGALSGNLTITDDAAGSPHSVTLSGTGILANPTFSPLSLTFGKVRAGSVSAIKSVTITNPNILPLNVASIGASAQFAVVADSCGSSIPAGGNCQVSVTFNPITYSSCNGSIETGKLTLADDGKTASQSVILVGTAFSACINGVYDMPNYNTTIPSAITGNSAVDGIAIRTYWSQIEANEGVYNWSIIDKMIAQVTPPNSNPGKKISISIYAGWGTPSWVYSAGAQSFSWVWDRNWGPAACSVVKMPLPWDPVFQSKWAAFVAAFGAKYDSNPYVTHVIFTGVNSHDAEMWLPHMIDESINVNGLTCTGYNDVADWQAVGYTRTLLEGALAWDSAQFANAFPDRPFAIETDPCSLPALDDNGNFFSSPANCGDQQGLIDFLNYGVDNYGRGRFIIQNDGLGANPPTQLSSFWNTITADSTYVDIGFQFSSAVGTTNFDGITQNGINMGAKFIEFYQSDLTNSGNAAEISSAHSQLISK